MKYIRQVFFFQEDYTLCEVHKAWRVGKGNLMNLSAVLTVLYSLFLSCFFLAAQNQTVIELHRTNSVAVLQNWVSAAPVADGILLPQSSVGPVFFFLKNIVRTVLVRSRKKLSAGLNNNFRAVMK